MTTTAAGDAAVARLNKATEAFEKIITGASNQVVDVPGYGNQPTLAARVDERLDETTATAAAEANRSRDEADRATTQANAAANSVTLAAAEFNKAKTQADRAQSEADRASQISGLDTVADAIGLATLPFPDVWIPLSDSLRMLAGYGREVKVGDDVVACFSGTERLSRASYFDKNGAFKIAVENEPRFEAKGLLIEGRSSNCVQYADKPAQWTAMDLRFATFSTLPEDGLSRAPTGVYRTTAASNTMRITSSVANQKQLAVGECLTSSARFKLSDQNVNFRFRFANQNGFQGGGLVGFDGSNQGSDATVSLSIKTLPDGYVSASATMTCKEAGLHYGEFYIIAKSSADIPVGTEVRVQFPQVEPLPSRSSFIPSDASEAVREADKPWIQRIGNDNYFGPVTISVDVSCNGPGVVGNITDARRGIFSGYPSVGAYQILMIDPGNGRSTWAYGNTTFSGGSNQPIATDGATHTVVAQMDGSINRCYTDGVKGNSELPAVPVYGADNGTGKGRLMLGYGAGGSLIRHLWGHMRNVRIWLQALSDTQCKAIR